MDANEDSDNVMKEDSQHQVVEKVKKAKPGKLEKSGVVYLSSVPEYMSVQRLRNVFDEFGDVNRTFFQPIEKSFGYKKGLLFSEGWVEFRKRSQAKYVALALNNKQVGGKKRNPWYNCIWNIKYLPKFTWTDVNADRELKRATHENRIRTEISQAKQQTSFYSGNVEFSRNLDRMKQKKIAKGEKVEGKTFAVTQRKTDEEIVAEKAQKRKIREQLDSEESQSKKQKNNTFGDNDEKKCRDFVMKNIFGSVL